MPRFMFLLRGADCATEKSPEEMQQSMQEMGAWMAKGQQDGWLLDVGDGLLPDGKVVHGDNTVTDGPYAESKELIGGYCMIEAADLDAAVEHAKAMPAAGALEVRQLAGHSMD